MGRRSSLQEEGEDDEEDERGEHEERRPNEDEMAKLMTILLRARAWRV